MRVTVIEVDDPKRIRELVFKDIKQNRRNAKLKKLIKEVRQLRRLKK